MRRARAIAGCLFLAAALAACGDEDEALVPAPSKADPAAYTQYVVGTAIARYENQGLDATIVHYSQPDSIDGQWYVFIIDADDRVIAHPDPGHVGLDLKGWVGTDANRYEFGPAMLAATEEGMWVSYVYRNPARGGAGRDDRGPLRPGDDRPADRGGLRPGAVPAPRSHGGRRLGGRGLAAGLRGGHRRLPVRRWLGAG